MNIKNLAALLVTITLHVNAQQYGQFSTPNCHCGGTHAGPCPYAKSNQLNTTGTGAMARPMSMTLPDQPNTTGAGAYANDPITQGLSILLQSMQERRDREAYITEQRMRADEELAARMQREAYERMVAREAFPNMGTNKGNESSAEQNLKNKPNNQANNEQTKASSNGVWFNPATQKYEAAAPAAKESDRIAETTWNNRETGKVESIATKPNDGSGNKIWFNPVSKRYERVISEEQIKTIAPNNKGKAEIWFNPVTKKYEKVLIEN